MEEKRVQPDRSLAGIGSSDFLRLAGADGLTIAAESFGKTGHAPIIFMHGGGQSRFSWLKAARAVAEHGYHALTLDLRGHGDSDWASDGRYDLHRYAADLETIIQDIGEPAVLVGASLGGLVALVTAARFPHLVRAVCLADVTPWMDESRTGPYRRTIQDWTKGFETVEAAAAAVNILRGTAGDGNPQRLRNHMVEGESGRLYWRWDPRFIGDEFVRDKNRKLLEQSAAQLRVPVLVMRAALSTLVTPAQIEQFKGLVPSLVHEEIAGVGHMVTGDDNYAYVPALTRFLERVSGHPAGC
ncbi:MAG: alpha/beta hydrolase [Bradyrhizobium sp.]|nr:alpha/beta hydrolase [Bradyrhizobium sp.]